MTGFQIERDAYGIPTVRADDLTGLATGQGFAAAEDRLWHLEWDRRRALGTFAALTGRATDVVSDSFARRARLVDAARAGYASLDAATRALLDAHAEGINRFLTSTIERPIELRELGCEPEPWEGWQSVAVFLVRHVNFATWQHKLWRARVFAAFGADGLARFSPAAMRGEVDVIVPSGSREAIGDMDAAGLFTDAGLAELEPLGLGLSGSNCWALSGARTASGRPLIAGDPHRSLEVPNVYYQLRLCCPAEDIHAAGFCFVGVPGIQHFGQNGHVAWGVTNAMSDYQDLFVERLPSAITDVRTEKVEVAGGDAVEVECALSGHGPIVIGGSANGVGLALSATGLQQPGGSLRLLIPMLRARSAAELDAALEDWVEPVNNFVIADSAGSIRYRTAGTIPDRPVANQWLPVPGWDAAFDWHGVIPDAELPRQADPPNGAIVTANQQVTAGEMAARIGVDVASPNRARRIWTRLATQTAATRHDQAVVHLDDVTPAGARFAAVAGHPALAGWDGSMHRASHQAALYAAARSRVVRMLTERLPSSLRANPFAPWEPPATSYPPIMRVDDVLDWWIAGDDRLLLVDGEEWPGVLHAAVAAVADERGTWGERHRLTPFHPLADRLGDVVRPRSEPISGADGCVMATNHVAGVTDGAMSGSTARYVWDLADPAASGWVVPLGVSGDPGSVHFADQTALYVEGRLIDVGHCCDATS